MKAIEIQGAYGLDNLKAAERAMPEPGPGEVVLKMKAASLNFRDLLTVIGMYGGAYKLPLVPLSDGCGEVVKVGAGVTRVKAGDRVATMFFQGWFAGPPRLEGLSTALGGPIDGCAQEYLRLSAEGVSKVPDYLSDEEVASLPCAALTAWRSLVVEGGLKAGDRVLVQGTGGVSIFALQFAKAAGAEVIATSSSDEKLRRVKALGADHVINYKTHPEWSKEVRRLTNGAGVDHVVEVGGANTLKHSIQSIRIGGHVSIIGVLSGAQEPFMVASLIGTNARLKGISVGSRENFEDMVRAMDLHRIRPIVDQVLPFGQLKEALQLMQGQTHFGKIALRF